MAAYLKSFALLHMAAGEQSSARYTQVRRREADNTEEGIAWWARGVTELR